MKALSFLGVSAYQTVTYYWKDGEGERKGLPKSREAAKFWNQITELRNNLAHCGMKSNAPQVNRIERQVQKIVEHLRVFLDER